MMCSTSSLTRAKGGSYEHDIGAVIEYPKHCWDSAADDCRHRIRRVVHAASCAGPPAQTTSLAPLVSQTQPDPLSNIAHPHAAVFLGMPWRVLQTRRRQSFFNTPR